MIKLINDLISPMHARIERDIKRGLKAKRRYKTISMHPEDVRRISPNFPLQVLRNTNEKRGSYILG